MQKELYKILIIEDSHDDAELYRRTIKKIFECEFDCKANAKSALQALQENAYDLILLDYHLPGMTGLELLKEITTQNILLHGPIIALTGQGNEDVAVEFMQLGVTEYIKKDDINLNSLSDAIHASLMSYNDQQLEFEKQEELRLFAHTVAHDLKAPLGRISAYVKLLAKKVDAAQKKYTSNIESDAGYMCQFLDDLMLYAETGRKSITTELLDLEEVVGKAIENLEINISAKDAEIRYGALGQIKGNKMALIRLFQNLISNSVKYCEGRPLIQISYENQSTDIIVKLTDNGIGIPPEMAEQAFKPFSRIPNQLEEQGTGLGLALCDKIMKQHQGNICIESSKNGKTIFKLRFPSLEQQTHPHQTLENLAG